MDLETLLEQKNNVFNHIFYEFEMYYDTFHALEKCVNFDECNLLDKQFCKNVLIESHATHLRNMIRFFSGQDGINANNVLVSNPIHCISNWDKKTIIVNNAISHLSEARVKESTGAENLTIKLDGLIRGEYPHMVERIKTFLDTLEDGSMIVNKYSLDFDSSTIRQQYQTLKELYNREIICILVPETVTTC